MTWALIGLLGTALFATIGLLAQALFALRGDFRGLQQELLGVHIELGVIRERLAGIEARLDALEAVR